MFTTTTFTWLSEAIFCLAVRLYIDHPILVKFGSKKTCLRKRNLFAKFLEKAATNRLRKNDKDKKGQWIAAIFSPS